MKDKLKKTGRIGATVAVLLMLVVTMGIPVPQIQQGGDIHVEQRQAVGESQGLAFTTAVGIGFAIGAGGAVIADAAYDHYIADRNETVLTNSELKIAIAQDAYSAQQMQENYLTDSQNAQQLSENSAKREAYRVYVNERAAGATHSEAVTAAKNRVDQFYASQQKQLISKYETQVVQGGGICAMESQWDDLGNDTKVRFADNTNKGITYDWLPAADMTCDYSKTSGIESWGGDHNVTNDNGSVAISTPLVNGETIHYRTPAVDTGSNAKGWAVLSVFDAGSSNNMHTDVLDETFYEVYDPDAGSYVRTVSPSDYAVMDQQIEAQHSTVQSTLGDASSGYLTDVKNAKQNNSWTWSNITVEKSIIDVENTSVTEEEYYERVLGQNLDGPDTGTIVTADVNGSNVTGQLYTSWAPSATNGSWTTGYTYNASQGVTYIVDSEGNLNRITGDMTITDITTQSGDSVSETTHNDVALNTSDTSDLKNQIDRLNNRIQEIENQQDSGGFAWPDLGGQSAIGVILIAAAALLLLRGGGSGGATVLAGRNSRE
jgi:hypothetical protein